MAALADLQKWRDTLFEARMNGVRSFADQNGERVEYSSDREMAAAIAACDRELAGMRRPHTVVFRKGI
ncbi:MAG: hypothetical protein ABI240_14630 [Sphingomonas sp.]